VRELQQTCVVSGLKVVFERAPRFLGHTDRRHRMQVKGWTDIWMFANADSFMRSQSSAAKLPLVVLPEAGRPVTTAAHNFSLTSCARQYTAYTL